MYVKVGVAHFYFVLESFTLNTIFVEKKFLVNFKSWNSESLYKLNSFGGGGEGGWRRGKRALPLKSLFNRKSSLRDGEGSPSITSMSL
jgi:hypothetical protein